MDIKQKISFLFAFLLLSLCSKTAFATISNVSINPDLDISYFSPYQIQADISGSPTSVSVNVTGINGDGGTDWDYNTVGTPVSSTNLVDMNYNASLGKWVSENVYPDSIYPEIYFAPSSITWNNAPSDISLRRNNYHLFHITNPFTMGGNMNFFFELNAEPNSTVNSTDLEVYLVRNNKNITFFNSDWRNNEQDLELIGTIGKEQNKNHAHSSNSGHYLIPLTANANGTIGTRSLDISGEFWIILYSQSPNVNRGWDLKYHDTGLCDNNNTWYVGDQARWRTASQSGCPDAHVHIARRGTNSDGVRTNVTADYSGTTESLAGSFYFEPLPNLAPLESAFVNPAPGSNHNGGAGKTINIDWNAVTDPNGDSVTYNIYLLDDNGNQIGNALVANANETSYLWDISGVADGEYGLKGESCDSSDACTAFYLSRNFSIKKTVEIYSLNDIVIASNNIASSNIAVAGDTVELTFTASGDISPSLSVSFFSGGEAVNKPVHLVRDGYNWTASYVVSSSDTVGTVSFIIKADNLDFEYTETPGDSYVLVYDPADPVQVATETEVAALYKKAKVTDWEAYKYKSRSLNQSFCQDNLKLKLKGKRFNKKARVFIGDREAASVKRISSKKLVAKFCLNKLLDSKSNAKRRVKVQNPNALMASTVEKIDLKDIELLKSNNQN